MEQTGTGFTRNELFSWDPRFARVNGLIVAAQAPLMGGGSIDIDVSDMNEEGRRALLDDLGSRNFQAMLLDGGMLRVGRR